MNGSVKRVLMSRRYINRVNIYGKRLSNGDDRLEATTEDNSISITKIG